MKLLSFPEMSLYGAILIAAVLLLRALFLNRLPKRTFSTLWGLAILRLLLPLSITSAVSLYALLPAPEPLTAPAPIPAASTPEPTVTFTPIAVTSPVATWTEPSPLPEYVLPTVTEPIKTAEPKTDVSPETVLTLIWCGGAALLLLVFTAVYLRGRREFRMSLPIQNDFIEAWQKDCPLRRKVTVRRSDRISAPLTYGVFRPVILLPDPIGTDEKTLEHILTHELVHIRRFDAVKKPLCALAVCLHWFNPLVWIMFFYFTRDLELACDEGAVRQLGIGDRSDYAKTLIGMEARKSGFLPFFSHFAGFAAEERIKAIMKLKKSSFITSIAAVLLICGTAGAFLTSAAEKPEEAKTIDDLTMDAQKPETSAKPQLVSDYKKQIEVLGEEENALLHEYQNFAEQQTALEEEIKQIEARLAEYRLTSETISDPSEAQQIAEECEKLEKERDDLLAEQQNTAEHQAALEERMEQTAARLAECEAALAEITPGSSEWEWWTAEEYEKWIEEQEKEMESLIGTGNGWYDKQGEFHTFTKENINDILALYRETLEEIKRGVLVSKPSDDGVVLMQSLPKDEEQTPNQDELEKALKPYLPFGITVRYDQNDREAKMYYREKEVRALYDETAGLFISNHAGLWNYGKNALDLYAVYTDGVLTGVREATEAEWEENTAVRRTNTQAWLLEQDEVIEAVEVTQTDLSEAYVMTPEQEKARINGLFAEYERFGLTRDKKGKVYFHGKPVRIFFDGVDHLDDVSMISRYTYLNENGEIDVRTLWTPKDNGDGSVDPFGTMIGIEETKTLNINNFRVFENEAVTEMNVADVIPKISAGSGSGTDPIPSVSVIEADSTAQTSLAEGNSAAGTTIPDIFAKYEPFGITYNKSEGNVYFNGKLVRTFVNYSENGIFTYQSQNVGNREAVDVRVIYENGKPGLIMEMSGAEKNANFMEQPEDETKMPLLTGAPLSEMIISADFGEYYSHHKGIDLSAKAGTEIYAFADGTVVEAGYDNSNGNYLLIDHENGLQTLYAHCSELYVKAGGTIKKGTVIAAVGSSGYATGSFLHFELRKDGTPIDPKLYLNERPEITVLDNPDISEILAAQTASPLDQKYRSSDQRIGNQLYFTLPQGEEIYSVADGTVVFSGYGTAALGRIVVVKSTDGTCWGYGHLDPNLPAASLGDTVKAGDVIGHVGTTGWVTEATVEIFLAKY